MKPARFDYVAPTTLSAAIDALVAAGGDGKVLAGGQSLLPLLNFRMARPSLLVDLNGIRELAFIEQRGDTIVIGALTRHAELERSPLIAAKMPVMSAAMRHVAHLAIRNRGTIGGSLSHADPAAELPMLAMFYDATVIVHGPEGRRAIAAVDFFVDALTTCLAADEIVTEIEFPLLDHGGWAFEEVARRFGDFALASIAVALRAGEGRITALRVGAMGVGDTPLRLGTVEQELQDAPIDVQLPARFRDLVRATVSPGSDLHGSGDYRRHLLGELAARAMQTAMAKQGS